MVREKIKLYDDLKRAYKQEWRLCQDQITGKWSRHYILTGEAKVKMYRAHADLSAEYVMIEKIVIMIAIEKLKQYDLQNFPDKNKGPV